MAVGLGLRLVLLGVALAHRIVDALDEPVGVVAHPRLRVANGGLDVSNSTVPRFEPLACDTRSIAAVCDCVSSVY
jgi:hypothetical protein